MSNALAAARPSVRDLLRCSPDVTTLDRDFDRHYPDHWATFCQVATALRAAGVKVWGCRGVLENMRYLCAIKGGANTEGFRASNDVSDCLARRWRRDHPAASGFFRVRLPGSGLRRHLLRLLRK